MGDFASRVGYYLSRPQDIIYAVASAALYPTLFAEVAALLYVAFQAGALTVEGFRRRKARKLIDLEATANGLAEANATGEEAKVSALLSQFEYGPVIGPVARVLSTEGVDPVRTLKLLGDAERTAVRRLDRTRIFIRIGPILGLMGTLIPISPALVALAQGDTQTLSANLVVAFSTTVVGLIIGGIGYVCSIIRERMYAQDLADLEYVLECMKVQR